MNDVKVEGQYVHVTAGEAHGGYFGPSGVTPEQMTPGEAEAFARRILTAARAARPGFKPKPFGEH